MTVIQFADLRPGVVRSPTILRDRSSAGQHVIGLGAEACEVDWSPKAYHHHALLLPLILLTAAIDRGAAAARRAGVSFVEAVGEAPRLDVVERWMLVSMAEGDRRTPFASELAAWIERFGLAGVTLEVDEARLSGGDHYGVRPIVPLGELPPILKALPRRQLLATLAVCALYNDTDTLKVFRGKRLAAMNIPAVEGFAAVRDEGGPEAEANLLRLIAAYSGW
jgi:hypothetical protein